MKRITLLLFTAVTLFAVTSCSKDDDNGGNNNNNNNQGFNKAYLTAKPWKATGLTVGGGDFWSLVDACEKDNLYTFKSDGTYIEDEGASKCDPGDPQVITTSTWAMINNNTQLVYDGDTATIKELSSTKMVLESNISGATAVGTFEAQ